MTLGHVGVGVDHPDFLGQPRCHPLVPSAQRARYESEHSLILPVRLYGRAAPGATPRPPHRASLPARGRGLPRNLQNVPASDQGPSVNGRPSSSML